MIIQEYAGVQWETTFDWINDTVMIKKYSRPAKNITISVTYIMNKKGYVQRLEGVNSTIQTISYAYDSSNNLSSVQKDEFVFYKNSEIDSVRQNIGQDLEMFKIRRANDMIQSIVKYTKNFATTDTYKDSISYTYQSDKYIFAKNESSKKIDTAFFENGLLVKLSFPNDFDGGSIYTFTYPKSVNILSKEYHKKNKRISLQSIIKSIQGRNPIMLD